MCQGSSLADRIPKEKHLQHQEAMERRGEA
jgi:hypothetical protein